MNNLAVDFIEDDEFPFDGVCSIETQELSEEESEELNEFFSYYCR